MRRKHCIFLGVTVAVTGFAACADQPTIDPDPDGAPREARNVPLPQAEAWNSDDEYARVSRAEVPGFAGFYLEDDGTPVILLKDHRQEAVAKRYLAQATRSGRRAGAPPAPVIRRVTHDFATLKGWFDTLLPLLERDDVYMLDIDEVGNRVSMGVRDQNAIGLVRREAALLRVPPAVLSLEIRPAPEERATLQEWTATLAGGYQIEYPPNASGSICTFGFNAVYDGAWAFVTNSHCTYVKNALDGGTITQPRYYAGNEIGVEVRDRGNYACNGLFTSCRRSDAAYIRHNGSRGIGQGQIAYTPLNSATTRDLTVVGTYDVIRRYAGSVPVGLYLDKTGRTTGWTYGQVTESCVAIDNLRCQDVSTVYSEPGDSGSPMYYWLGNEQVELYGILWGGPEYDYNTTYSSRLSGIEQDLGTLTYVCAPGYGC